MSVCGRCRGRRVVKPTRGFGDQVCPKCNGTGEKPVVVALGKGKARLVGPTGACRQCGNPALDWHHVVSQQRIQRLVTAAEQKAALEDRRNLVPLCRTCHARVERAMLRIEPHQLHWGFWGFVRDFDLGPAVPRYLAERWAA